MVNIQCTLYSWSQGKQNCFPKGWNETVGYFSHQWGITPLKEILWLANFEELFKMVEVIPHCKHIRGNLKHLELSACKQGLIYTAIPWLLMAWGLMEPRHQQSWYWLVLEYSSLRTRRVNSLGLSDSYTNISNLTIIGSDNALSPGQCQATIWTNAGILLIDPWEQT